MQIQVGKPVTGSNLIGREQELREFEQCIEMGQSVALIAPRRYGKTSLLLEILQRSKQQNRFSFYLDLFSIPDLYDLAAEITKGVLSNRRLDFSIHQLKNQISDLMQNLQFRQEVEGSEFILGFGQSSANAWDLLRSSLQLIETFSQKHETQTVAVFDEFGDVGKLDGEQIVKLFRAELQLQASTICLFSGSYESVMSNTFVSPKAPFYRFARIFRLQPIDPEVFQKHLTAVFRQEGFAQPEPFAGQITRFTNGHPYYTQLLAQQALFHHKAFANKDRSFQDLLTLSLDTEVNYCEKVWDEISAKHQEKQVLLELAKGNSSLYAVMDSRKINISRTVKRLLNSGLLEKANGAYSFTDPLLRYWIREKILKLSTPLP